MGHRETNPSFPKAGGAPYLGIVMDLHPPGEGRRAFSFPTGPEETPRPGVPPLQSPGTAPAFPEDRQGPPSHGVTDPPEKGTLWRPCPEPPGPGTPIPSPSRALCPPSQKGIHGDRSSPGQRVLPAPLSPLPQSLQSWDPWEELRAAGNPPGTWRVWEHVRTSHPGQRGHQGQTGTHKHPGARGDPGHSRGKECPDRDPSGPLGSCTPGGRTHPHPGGTGI